MMICFLNPFLVLILTQFVATGATDSLTKPQQPTEDEKRANSSYENAKQILNGYNPDRPKAYQLLLEAAKLNHSKAMLMSAQALLFGDHLKMNFPLAKRFLKQLASEGDPSAQMVSGGVVFFRR